MNESLCRVSGGQYYAPLGRHQDQVGHGKLLTGMQELGSGRSRCLCESLRFNPIPAYCILFQVVIFPALYLSYHNTFVILPLLVYVWTVL